MRIGGNQIASIMQDSISDSKSAIADLLKKMDTGAKLINPSDDPVASVRLIRLAREESAIKQYQTNIKTLNTRLANDESCLDSINKNMMRVNDLLVWASNGTISNDDLKSIGTELSSLKKSMVESCNTENQDGHYLFSGTAIDSKTIQEDKTKAIGQRFSFQGNTKAQSVIVGPNITERANTTLSEMAGFLNQLDKVTAIIDGKIAPDAGKSMQDMARDMLNPLRQTQDQILGKISVIGGTQKAIQLLSDNQSSVSLVNKTTLKSINSLDYPEAYTELNDYMMALQSSMKAYGKINGLSLFDVM